MEAAIKLWRARPLGPVRAFSEMDFRKAAHGDARRRLEYKPPYLALGARMLSAGRAGCPQPAAVGVHDLRARNGLLNGKEFCEPL